MNILIDSQLPGLNEAFPSPFVITTYERAEELPDLLGGQDILLCRSTLKVNASLLKEHQLKYVGTASSGTDHLDRAFLESQKITVLDAKGCNAASVADYVLSCIAFLNRKKLIKGKKAGVIGIGKAGSQVCERLESAGFEVIKYDPLKEMNEQQFQSSTVEELCQADLICIHAELHNTLPYPSLNLINDAFLTQLKSDCVIINASRGGIVDEDALLRANPSLTYCTDVYLHEPEIDKRIVDRALLCTPHIAGHSLEAKYMAVAMVSSKLHEILGLPLPEFAIPVKPEPLERNKPWQELVLSIYNPLAETLELKQAEDLKSTFTSLRKRHQQRHDFATYFAM